jgi:putative ABC transport system substrate-binding protein
MRRVAVLSSAGSTDTSDPETQTNVTAFVQALQQLGWENGRNLRIDHRVGGNNVERIRKLVAELAALPPDVIVTAGATSVGPLLQATRTVPVVRECRRPCWRWLCRKPCKAGGKCYGLCVV